MRNVNTLIAAMTVGALALAGSAIAEPPAGSTTPTTAPVKEKHEKKLGGDHKKDKGEKKDEKSASAATAKVGEKAPDFTLTDTDGKTHKLSDMKGKVVLVEWYNPQCPFILKHHKNAKTFNDLYTSYHSKGVEFLAINSSAAGKEGAGKDLNAKSIKDFGMQYPVALDESGVTGKAYGAKNTPAVFIIDADGTLVYKGAIDNDPSADKVGDKNYAKMALDEVLAHKKVTTAETKPYGCGVKYGE